jgi:uncharacterized membrane protein
MAVIRTERGLDRLVNFSDATVAIAITLLVLPLVDAAADIDRMSVAEWMGHNLGSLIGFGVSFIVIARFWVTHHQVFEWVVDYSRGLVWANFLWLAAIVFLPFTTNLLSNASPDRADVDGLYIGNMLVLSLSFLLIEVQLRRHPELVREDARGQLDVLHAVATPIILAVALVLAVLFPAIGLWWLFLLLLTSPLERLLALTLGRGSQKRA